MKIYVDDGSTNIKLAWVEDGKVKTFMSPNSFKREWSMRFGESQGIENYEIEGEQFAYDTQAADAEVTTDTRYQYSRVNTVAIHHALHASGIKPQPVDITVTLPLSEFLTSGNTPNDANIARKKSSVKRAVDAQGATNFVVGHVNVLPESIPAGFVKLGQLTEDEALLIVDLGGTTLDVSQVKGQMSGITMTYCDPKIGVSMVTNGIRDVMAGAARTRISPLTADKLLISYEGDAALLTTRIFDATQRAAVVERIKQQESVLGHRVSDALERFSGYTHVMCVGGGANIQAVIDAVKQATQVPADRFFVSGNAQYDLVLGMLNMNEEINDENAEG